MPVDCMIYVPVITVQPRRTHHKLHPSTFELHRLPQCGMKKTAERGAYDSRTRIGMITQTNSLANGTKHGPCILRHPSAHPVLPNPFLPRQTVTSTTRTDAEGPEAGAGMGMGSGGYKKEEHKTGRTRSEEQLGMSGFGAEGWSMNGLVHRREGKTRY